VPGLKAMGSELVSAGAVCARTPTGFLIPPIPRKREEDPMKNVLQAVSGVAALAVGGKKNKDEDGSAGADNKSVGAVSVKAQLDRTKIDKGEDYDGHMMVSVTGSDKDFKRTPICTVLVLDVSGSMGGTKMDLLKETATKIAQNLTDKDEIAIVAFASHVETILERTNAADKSKIVAAISRLHATTMTNMSGGFQQGLRQVNEKFKGVKRIMLLTDGQANQGISDRAGLLDVVSGRDSCCTMSTFGEGWRWKLLLHRRERHQERLRPRTGRYAQLYWAEPGSQDQAQQGRRGA